MQQEQTVFFGLLQRSHNKQKQCKSNTCYFLGGGGGGGGDLTLQLLSSVLSAANTRMVLQFGYQKGICVLFHSSIVWHAGCIVKPEVCCVHTHTHTHICNFCMHLIAMMIIETCNTHHVTVTHHYDDPSPLSLITMTTHHHCH